MGIDDLDVFVMNNSPDDTFFIRVMNGRLPDSWHFSVDFAGDASRHKRHLYIYSAPHYPVLQASKARALGQRHLTEEFSAGQISRLREGTAHLLIDVSNEAPPLSMLGIPELVEFLDENRISHTLVHFLSANANLADEASDYGLMAHFVDYFALMLAIALSGGSMHEEQSQLQLVMERKVFGSGQFLCLNSTPRKHRVALFACLTADDLVGSNFVTWGGWSHYKAKPLEPGERAWIEWLLSGTLSDALPFVALALEQGPLRFDAKFVNGNELALEFPSLLFAASDFSIVTETSVDSDVWRISEKTLKAVAAGHPPLVFGHPNTKQLLERYGFSVDYDDWLWQHDGHDDVRTRLGGLRESYRMVLDDPRSMLHPQREVVIKNMAFARERMYEYLRSTMLQPVIDLFNP